MNNTNHGAASAAVDWMPERKPGESSKDYRSRAAQAAWMHYVADLGSPKAAFLRVLEAFTTEGMRDLQPPDTMKVRICVAVDTDGHWAAHGERGDSDTEMMTYSSDNVSEPYALTFVEAYVSLPRALSTVKALPAKE